MIFLDIAILVLAWLCLAWLVDVVQDTILKR
jgi:hypothetical protein